MDKSKTLSTPEKFENCSFERLYCSESEEFCGVRIYFQVGNEEFASEVIYKNNSVSIMEFRTGEIHQLWCSTDPKES